jgi:hypothetical protein
MVWKSFRNRPLWVAWYNENQTRESVLRNAAAYGWTGKCLIWQYASDGDANDDGIADGKGFGMDMSFLDLNGWVASEDDYKEFIGNASVGIPNPEPEPEQPLPNEPMYSIKVIIPNLNVRSEPKIASGNILRTIGYVQLKVYEERNGWGKISPTNEEWLSLNSAYAMKLDYNAPAGITNWVVTAPSGLNIRSEPNANSVKIGAMPYNTRFTVTSTDNGWGMMYGRDGYTCLAYAKQI